MARIRTIKPEFWTHPVMSNQTDEVRLAAVALLNLADDEGYFLAAPSLVRSFIWPFIESSVKAHGVLTTLVSIGWVELTTHPTHGQIGRVVNFTKHQLINRASHSKIKAYWFSESSVNPHGAITDNSQHDQGSGNRDQGTGSREEIAPAPTASQDNLKTKNREALARALRRAGLPSTESALVEWKDALQGTGTCRTIDEVLECLEVVLAKAKADGHVIGYAKHAKPYLERFAEKLAKRREADQEDDQEEVA